MLTRFRTRRAAALLALASMTNAASLLPAQAPIGGASIGGPGGTSGGTRTLISDCEAWEHCGGPPTLDGYGGGGIGGGFGGDGGGGCGTGSRILCREDVYTQCLKWVPLTASGGGGLQQGITGSTTMVCSEQRTTTIKLYWP